MVRQKVIGTNQVASRLGLDPDSVARLFRQGRIPGAFKADGHWKIAVEDLERHIQRRTANPVREAHKI